MTQAFRPPNRTTLRFCRLCERGIDCRTITCSLCGHGGGAFKPTTDGAWAHVHCAIWLPDVGFASTDRMEEIDTSRMNPARQAGMANVETRELDGERHDLLPAASFDAAVSRVGLIYFPDQQRALAHDACATRDLRFGERTVAAADVQAAFMAALGAFARVATAAELAAELPPA